MPLEKSYKLLIAEDSDSIQMIYDDILGLRYDITFCTSLTELENILKSQEGFGFDAGIIDLKLSDGVFLEFLADPAKQKLINFDYIVVSGICDLDVLRYCFDSGVTDYLTKPFAKEELLVKVQMLLQKSALGRLLNDQAVSGSQFTPKEKLILTSIVENQGKLDKSELIQRVWKREKVSHNTFDVHLSNLRKKVKQLGYEIKCVDMSRYAIEKSGLEDGDKVTKAANCL